MGGLPRGLALCVVLIFLACTALGSVLPEFGNLLAVRLGNDAHSLNILFLILGLVGVGVALYLGYTHSG